MGDFYWFLRPLIRRAMALKYESDLKGAPPGERPPLVVTADERNMVERFLGAPMLCGLPLVVVGDRIVVP